MIGPHKQFITKLMEILNSHFRERITYGGCKEQAEFITWKIVDELIACKKKFTLTVNKEDINKHVERQIYCLKSLSCEAFINTVFFNNVKISFSLYTGEEDFKVIVSHSAENDVIDDNDMIDCIYLDVSSTKYSNKYRNDMIEKIKDGIIDELMKSWEHYSDKH